MIELPTQTTFIPKKPITQEYREESSSSLVSTISVGLFLISLLLAGGVYFYSEYTDKNVAVKKKSLDISQGRFEPQTLQEFKDIDKRLSAAKIVLHQHIAITPVFDILSQLTLKNIQYTKFGYKFDEAGKSVTVTLSGVTNNYETIALQSDNFSKNKLIQDPVFSNLNLDTNGKLVFDLNFNVDPSLINFVETVNRNNSVKP